MCCIIISPVTRNFYKSIIKISKFLFSWFWRFLKNSFWCTVLPLKSSQKLNRFVILQRLMTKICKQLSFHDFFFLKCDHFWSQCDTIAYLLLPDIEVTNGQDGLQFILQSPTSTRGISFKSCSYFPFHQIPVCTAVWEIL